jgi:signal transduction histidine kinase
MKIISENWQKWDIRSNYDFMKQKEIIRKLLVNGDFEIMAKTFPMVAITGIIGYFAFYFTGKALGMYENLGIRIICALLFFLLFFIKKDSSLVHRLAFEFILAFCLPFFYSLFFFANSCNLNWGAGIVFGGFVYGFLTGKLIHTVTIYPFAVVSGFIAYSIGFQNGSLEPFLNASDTLIISVGAGIMSSMIKLVINSYLLLVLNLHKEQKLMVENLRHSMIVEETGELEKSLSLMYRLETIAKLVKLISKDFNDMLSIISLQASLLSKRYSDEKRLKKIVNIQEATEKSSSLLNTLSLFAQKKVSNMETIDLHLLIDRTIELIDKDLLKLVNIEKKLDARYSIVRGNEVLLQNAFLNLLINASHAMPDGGTLCIESTNSETLKEHHFFQDRLIKLKISDTGIGIDKSIIDRIFEPFFTTKDIGKGSGLGLAMVFGTVKQHGGTIAVSSIVGAGTSFIIDLPVTDKLESDLIEPTVTIQTRQSTILLVEPDIGLTDTLKELLEYHKIDLIHANKLSNLKEIIDLHKNKIDLILLDLSRLDENHANTFFNNLGKQTDLPVVVIGNFNPDDWNLDGRNVAVPLLKKPIIEQNLLKMISIHLNMSK